MTRIRRSGSLLVTVPLAVLTAVLLTRTMRYPAIGMSAVLGLVLLVLALPVLSRLTGEPAQSAASLDLRDLGCLLLALLAVSPVLILPVDRPWNAPWWPGRHESASLPDPCEVGRATASTLVPGGPGTADHDDDGPYGPTKGCTWRDPDGASTLTLEYQLVNWEGTFGGSATDSARDALAGAFTLGTRVPLLGVGDEAWRADWGAFHHVAARRANVIVEVRLSGAPPPPDEAARRSAEERLLRTAVEHVRIR
ncbi:hypothetical protein GCM10022244_03230 [Streptomyces gulbargensis]|uniref:DUF3558 domain-containing protein n=1 Tax=Streptomyces gulbargensis TaxID=364901 RepID=A0ABP7LA33_9ACTN